MRLLTIALALCALALIGQGVWKYARSAASAATPSAAQHVAASEASRGMGLEP